jgi:hypothetical protein
MIRSQVLRLTNIYNNNYVLPAYNIVVNKTKLLEKVLIEHSSSILILKKIAWNALMNLKVIENSTY